MIIMDEVDGMSAGDRGGVGALNALIRKSKVPIIAICNDKSTPKMKPLTLTCFQMGFKRQVEVARDLASVRAHLAHTRVITQADGARGARSNDVGRVQGRHALRGPGDGPARHGGAV